MTFLGSWVFAKGHDEAIRLDPDPVPLVYLQRRASGRRHRGEMLWRRREEMTADEPRAPESWEAGRRPGAGAGSEPSGGPAHTWIWMSGLRNRERGHLCCSRTPGVGCQEQIHL